MAHLPQRVEMFWDISSDSRRPSRRIPPSSGAPRLSLDRRIGEKEARGTSIPGSPDSASVSPSGSPSTGRLLSSSTCRSFYTDKQKDLQTAAWEEEELPDVLGAEFPGDLWSQALLQQHYKPSSSYTEALSATHESLRSSFSKRNSREFMDYRGQTKEPSKVPPWQRPLKSSARPLSSYSELGGPQQVRPGTSRAPAGPAIPAEGAFESELLAARGTGILHRSSAADLLQHKKKSLQGPKRGSSWSHPVQEYTLLQMAQAQQNRYGTKGPPVSVSGVPGASRLPVSCWSMLTKQRFSTCAGELAQAAASAAAEAAAAAAARRPDPPLASSAAAQAAAAAANAAAAVAAAAAAKAGVYSSAGASSVTAPLPGGTLDSKSLRNESSKLAEPTEGSGEKDLEDSQENETPMTVQGHSGFSFASLAIAAANADSLAMYAPPSATASTAAATVAAAAVAAMSREPGAPECEAEGRDGAFCEKRKSTPMAEAVTIASGPAALGMAAAAEMTTIAESGSSAVAAISSEKTASAATSPNDRPISEDIAARGAVGAATITTAATAAAAVGRTEAGGIQKAESPCTMNDEQKQDARSRVPPLLLGAIAPINAARESICRSENSTLGSSSRSSISSIRPQIPVIPVPQRRWKVLDMPMPLRLKVVTAGPPASGKSCLVRRFCERRFAGVSLRERGARGGATGPRTIACDFGLRDVVLPTKETVRLHFVDLSGEPVFAEATEGAFEGADLLLMVFDSTDPASLTAALEALQQAQEKTGDCTF